MTGRRAICELASIQKLMAAVISTALVFDLDRPRFCLRFFPLSHAKHASTSSLSPSRLSLHLLADLDVDFEELCHASIQTNRLSFVEITFAVVGRYALLRTRLI
jgi:hypothetical protein